ncbi:MAG: GNAT family N-acetyltransferase [Fimbriimonadaceae bacterium]
MAIGWQGERIRFVPLDKSKHGENCYRWINDPDISDWILIGDFPITPTAEDKFLEELSAFSEKNVIFAVELLDGTHIGQSGIHGIDIRHGFATTGSFIGAKEHQGVGLGTEASQLRAWYCFYVLGLRLITSGYLEGNIQSQRMNEKTGYVEFGRVPKQYWKRGMYRDHIHTLLTRERWLELSGGNKSW